MEAALTALFPGNVNQVSSSPEGIEITSNLQPEEPDLRSALQQLETISALQKDWDSYGSDPPTPEAILAARQLIADAYRNSKLVPYFVAPISGGGVQLEWRGPRREIEVELGSDGKSFSYLLIEEKGTAHRRAEEKHDVPSSQILDVIRSVVS
jgi:hypothetical protein